jgi:hypothetical protein
MIAALSRLAWSASQKERCGCREKPGHYDILPMEQDVDAGSSPGMTVESEARQNALLMTVAFVMA